MANFCSKCGNALPTDGSSCPNCAAVRQSATDNQNSGKPLSQMTIGEIGQSVTKSAKSIKFDASNEDNATVSIAGNKVKAGTIIKVITITLCVIFFLPYFSVSCSGMKINFSGLESAFGKTMSSMGSSQKIEGNILAIFLLLIPAAMFVAFQFKKNLAFIHGKLFKVSTGLSGLGLVSFIIFAIAVNSSISGQASGMISPDYTFWYYFSIILYIVSGLISLGCVTSVKSAGQQNNSAPPSVDDTVSQNRDTQS